MGNRLSVRWRPLALMMLSAALVSGTSATPASAAAPKVKCKRGEIPVLTGPTTKPKLAKTKAGKARCAKPPKLKAARVEPAAPTPQGTVSSTADSIAQALTVDPDALAKTEKRVGKKATKALVDRALNGWRSGAKTQATRFADDPGFHYQGTFGDAAKGTSGSATIDAGSAGEGGAGVKASATIEFSADAAGLKELGADKVTSAKSAKLKLEISFEDAPTQCPTSVGKVKGTVKASAVLTITTDGVTQTMSAKVDASYELTVGADARWKTIDNVDVKTEFSFGGTGQKTETWRGRRAGEGFGQRGIFGEGSGDAAGAIAEQQSHVNPNKGGVWGPRGRVLFDVPSTDNIFNYGGSIAHLKGMILTDVATNYLLIAAVEYIRQVVAPRGQKHWYDDEACLKIVGKPAAAKLSAGQKTSVTASDAKAADGTPVEVSLTASGSASLTPAGAALGAGATKDFELTAPNQTPTISSWNIVAIGRAGKKTVSGTLGDTPRYTVVLDDQETGTFATHVGAARMRGTLSLIPVEGSNPQRWTASGRLEWSEISAAPQPGFDCDVIAPVTSGTWAVEAVQAETDQVTFKIDLSADAKVNATFHCPTDEGFVDIPGEPLAIPVGFSPTTFLLPNVGGVQPIAGEVTTGEHGLRSRGSVTVTATG